MKKLTFVAIFFAMAYASFAQNPIVITEIMYNTPESGTDTLEYIELYNNGSAAVNLNGYRFTAGIVDTLPDFTLDAGKYLVIAYDSAYFHSRFGITALEWRSGSLNNSGETIKIVDAAGSFVDSVAYDDTAPWPTAPDGNGPALVLCDVNADNNDAANWSAATTPTGVVVNGIELLGSPGAANSCASGGYPVYPIAKVTTVNADGIPDSLNVRCELTGVVYGYNLRSGGLEFTIIDNNGDGIRVFSATEDYGYTVTEGDEVTVDGTIIQFSGLTQISVDNVTKVSANNTLLTPTVVTALGENTESKFIKIENLHLVNSAEWTNTGTGFNVSVSDGTNTFTMRVDDLVDIFGMAPPSGTFSVTGIGTQFDNTSPYTDGYQIQPRYIQDIDPYVAGTVTYPYYHIALARTNAADGRPDSLGRKAEFRAIVYGPNIRGNNGLQFTMIETGGSGISVFSSSNTFGYTVQEGDSLIVRGTVDFFNGLTEMVPDTLWMVSQNNPLREPTVVTTLDEFSESQLVKINNLTLVDPTQWTNSSSGFNVDVTDGASTFQMRVDADVNVFGTAAPTGTFNLTGLGSQFDSSSPYDAGYQIFPRYIEDIDLLSSVLDPALAEGVKLYPNPTVDQLTLESPQGFDRIRITNVLGQPVLDSKNINSKAQFDLRQLATGNYQLTLVRGNRMWTLKFVKK